MPHRTSSAHTLKELLPTAEITTNALHQEFARFCLLLGLRISQGRPFHDASVLASDYNMMCNATDRVRHGMVNWTRSIHRLRRLVSRYRQSIIKVQAYIRRYLGARKMRILLCVKLWVAAETSARYTEDWVDERFKRQAAAYVHRLAVGEYLSSDLDHIMENVTVEQLVDASRVVRRRSSISKARLSLTQQDASVLAKKTCLLPQKRLALHRVLVVLSAAILSLTCSSTPRCCASPPTRVRRKPRQRILGAHPRSRSCSPAGWEAKPDAADTAAMNIGGCEKSPSGGDKGGRTNKARPRSGRSRCSQKKKKKNKNLGQIRPRYIPRQYLAIRRAAGRAWGAGHALHRGPKDLSQEVDDVTKIAAGHVMWPSCKPCATFKARRVPEARDVSPLPVTEDPPRRANLQLEQLPLVIGTDPLHKALLSYARDTPQLPLPRPRTAGFKASNLKGTPPSPFFLPSKPSLGATDEVPSEPCCLHIAEQRTRVRPSAGADYFSVVHVKTDPPNVASALPTFGHKGVHGGMGDII